MSGGAPQRWHRWCSPCPPPVPLLLCLRHRCQPYWHRMVVHWPPWLVSPANNSVPRDCPVKAVKRDPQGHNRTCVVAASMAETGTIASRLCSLTRAEKASNRRCVSFIGNATALLYTSTTLATSPCSVSYSIHLSKSASAFQSMLAYCAARVNNLHDIARCGAAQCTGLLRITLHAA